MRKVLADLQSLPEQFLWNPNYTYQDRSSECCFFLLKYNVFCFALLLIPSTPLLLSLLMALMRLLEIKVLRRQTYIRILSKKEAGEKS